MQNTEEIFIGRAAKASVLQSGVLWLDDGVFYVSLPVEGEAQPLTVALHGVSNQTNATEACRALLRLTESTERLERSLLHNG